MLSVPPNVAFEKLEDDDEGIEEDEEEEASPSSPLQPLRKNLRVLRFVAFPLYFADDYRLGKKRFFGVVIAAQGEHLIELRVETFESAEKVHFQA